MTFIKYLVQILEYMKDLENYYYYDYKYFLGALFRAYAWFYAQA